MSQDCVVFIKTFCVSKYGIFFGSGNIIDSSENIFYPWFEPNYQIQFIVKSTKCCSECRQTFGLLQRRVKYLSRIDIVSIIIFGQMLKYLFLCQSTFCQLFDSLKHSTQQFKRRSQNRNKIRILVNWSQFIRAHQQQHCSAVFYCVHLLLILPRNVLKNFIFLVLAR